MTIVFWIVLLIALGIITSPIWVGLIEGKFDEHKSEKNKEMVRENCLKDLLELEEFMQDHNITIPADSDKYSRLSSCLAETGRYYEKILIHKLRENGFNDSFLIPGCGRIFYNAEKVLVFPNIFTFLGNLKPEMQGQTLKYSYSSTSTYTPKMSLLEVKLMYGYVYENAYDHFALKLQRDKVYWFVKGGSSEGYRALHNLSGALAGGILLGGPIGMAVGQKTVADDLKKEDKKKMIIFGQQDSNHYWEISGADFNYVFSGLSKHLPDRKYADVYDRSLK